MRTVIYARYSSELQSDASIEDQVRLCRERAASEGHQVIEVFSDRAISGGHLHNRPGMLKLLERARAGHIDVVLAESLDRLSRDQEEVAAIYKRLTHAGVTITTLAEGGDQRAPYRPQGHDERAVPEGSRRQDAARTMRPR